jgi:L-lactate dehydrogenase (cytochrome)
VRALTRPARSAVNAPNAVPIVLKGVQTWEDALLAYDAGLAGVVLSNHGGRQLEFARSGLEVLAEVVRELGARRGLVFPNDRFALFVDGGVRRATDVLKARAMGASAVGLGRPFVYAFSAYGQPGVEKALQILKVCCAALAVAVAAELIGLRTSSR